MNGSYELSVVIPTYPPRLPKLEALLRGIAATRSDCDAFEVVLVVDAEDDTPLERARALLPDRIALTGVTQPNGGPAQARNHGLRVARGDWVLIYDDDALVDRQTIPFHLQQIRRDPHALVAYLGRTDWPPRLIDSPWRYLLEQTPMLFFWNQMTGEQLYNFRHFWTSNISVRRDLVLDLGGFDGRFPDAMHEDIELGWRLEQRYGLRVQVLLESLSWHDHPLSPRDYFVREWRSGRSAAAARKINPAFFEAIWGHYAAPDVALDTLRPLFTLAGRQLVEQFNQWAVPSPQRLSPSELQTAYLAHLPLKRMVFYQGMLGRPFEALWADIEPAAPATTPAEVPA